ncbi:MAG: PAS domain-containing protein [Devosia sp.]
MPDDDYAAVAARSISDVIVVADQEGRLVWANHAFEQMTAYAVSDVVGQNRATFCKEPIPIPRRWSGLPSACAHASPLRPRS